MLGFFDLVFVSDRNIAKGFLTDSGFWDFEVLICSDRLRSSVKFGRSRERSDGSDSIGE